MDLLDLILVLVGVAACVGGYRIGFLGRVVSWAGLALGFYLGILFLPTVVVDLASASPGVQLAVSILLLVGGAMVGQAAGLILGSRLHSALPLGPIRQADRVVGGVFGVIGVIAIVWLLVPSISSVPGWPARATAGSGIARWVSRDLPQPPDALLVLRRIIGQDAPQVFSELQSGTSVGAAPTAIPLTTAVANAVEASTVKVEGQACDRIYEGSGFAIGPDLIVTNAHVVAGESLGNTEVLLPSGRTLRAIVIMFDPNRDLALLSVRNLGEAPLSMSSPQVGQVGAVFGHPNGQDPVYASPARVAQQETAVGQDLYDSHTTRRQVLVLAAALAHGDSGGALVNTSGSVTGVAFAISADQSGTSYALNSTELQAALNEPRSPAGASTGPCLSS